MPSGKSPSRIIPACLIVLVFLFLDTHLTLVPTWFAWVVFFPIRCTAFIANSLHLGPDHQVLIQLLIGFPLEIVFLLGVLRVTRRRQTS